MSDSRTRDYNTPNRNSYTNRNSHTNVPRTPQSATNRNSAKRQPQVYFVEKSKPAAIDTSLNDSTDKESPLRESTGRNSERGSYKDSKRSGVQSSRHSTQKERTKRSRRGYIYIPVGGDDDGDTSSTLTSSESKATVLIPVFAFCIQAYEKDKSISSEILAIMVKEQATAAQSEPQEKTLEEYVIHCLENSVSASFLEKIIFTCKRQNLLSSREAENLLCFIDDIEAIKESSEAFEHFYKDETNPNKILSKIIAYWDMPEERLKQLREAAEVVEDGLLDILRTFRPEPEIRILLHGAPLSGFGLYDSKLDIAIKLPQDQWELRNRIILYTQKPLNRLKGVFDVVDITQDERTKASMLRLRFAKEQIVSHINVSRGTEVQGTRVLRLYASLHPHCAALGKLVKIWRTNRGFSTGKFPSTYTFMLLIIFFLQMRPKGPLLPVIDVQQIIQDDDLLISDREILQQYIGDARLRQEAELKDLVNEFFEFLLSADLLDSSKAVSVRTGGLISDVGFESKGCVYMVEDPITSSNNAAGTFRKNTGEEKLYFMQLRGYCGQTQVRRL
eukprot:TRINITY_DN8636_c0_g1_i2.p1 TRINITY_DN8636_c0_g1~~TRINITY_DN8636_c0_g1_i2.p1  ORF type:complete len:560 (+),score=93.16 TRINITY_DN8636_c0_g1_i2:172-1851(+)